MAYYRYNAYTFPWLNNLQLSFYRDDIDIPPKYVWLCEWCVRKTYIRQMPKALNYRKLATLRSKMHLCDGMDCNFSALYHVNLIRMTQTEFIQIMENNKDDGT